MPRQAKREKLEEEHWVSQLIPLLNPDIAEIIVKEPLKFQDDYQHMKQILFKRFKLSARALRNRFEFHDWKPSVPWSDLVYKES